MCGNIWILLFCNILMMTEHLWWDIADSPSGDIDSEIVHLKLGYCRTLPHKQSMLTQCWNTQHFKDRFSSEKTWLAEVTTAIKATTVTSSRLVNNHQADIVGYFHLILHNPPLRHIVIIIAKMLEKSVISTAKHQMGINRRSTMSEQTHTAQVTEGIRVKSCSWERR